MASWLVARLPGGEMTGYRVFYISRVFSNVRSVLSQCNIRLRLLYLLNKLFPVIG